MKARRLGNETSDVTEGGAKAGERVFIGGVASWRKEREHKFIQTGGGGRGVTMATRRARGEPGGTGEVRGEPGRTGEAAGEAGKTRAPPEMSGAERNRGEPRGSRRWP